MFTLFKVSQMHLLILLWNLKTTGNLTLKKLLIHLCYICFPHTRALYTPPVMVYGGMIEVLVCGMLS